MWNWLNTRCARMAGIIAIIAVIGLTGCPTDNGTGGGDGELSEAEREAILQELADAMEGNEAGTEYTPVEEGEDGRISLTGSDTTFIGYGINVFGGPTIAAALTSALFNNVVYATNTDEDGEYYISSDKTTGSQYTYSASESLSEAYTEMNLSSAFQTGTGVPFFSGNVSAQYGSSGSRSTDTRYYNAVYTETYKKQSLSSDYRAPLFLRDIVKSKTMKLINDSGTDPAWIFSNIGTHIIVDSGLGGNLNMAVAVQAETTDTNEDVARALNFDTPYVSGQISGNYSSKLKESVKNTKVTITAVGGEVSKLAGETSHAEMKGLIQSWAQTIKNDPTIGTVYSAVPIWKLAETTKRQKALEDAFNKNAAEINNNLNKYFSVAKEPAVVNGTAYYIKNWQSENYAIHVAGASYANSAELLLWDVYKNLPQAQWIAVESNVAPGYFAFKNVRSGKVMDIRTSNLANDANIYQYEVHMGDNQLFKVIENNDRSVSFESKLTKNKTRYYIRTRSATPKKDNRLVIYDKLANHAKWILEKVE